MPRVPIRYVAALLLTAVVAGPAAAQESRLVLEVHGGAAVPIGALKDGTGPGEGTAADASVSVTFVLPGTGRRGLYGGFSQHRFGCEDAGCASGGRYVATGFNIGFRIALLQGYSTVPWVRVGAITSKVETGDLAGPDAGVSDLAFGGEVGLGAYIGSRSPVAVVPAVLFSIANTKLPSGSTLSLRYVTAQLGIAFAF